MKSFFKGDSEAEKYFNRVYESYYKNTILGNDTAKLIFWLFIVSAIANVFVKIMYDNRILHVIVFACLMIFFWLLFEYSSRRRTKFIMNKTGDKVKDASDYDCFRLNVENSTPEELSKCVDLAEILMDQLNPKNNFFTPISIFSTAVLPLIISFFFFFLVTDINVAMLDRLETLSIAFTILLVSYVFISYFGNRNFYRIKNFWFCLRREIATSELNTLLYQRASKVEPLASK